ncbi:response regulator [Desulforhopalus sp. IMCC35007]|uniref:response regulator n=1 Tax=Desulforhopalus sp. IMCC35007 TaxID=2569543 RepID=UPI0010ADEC3D|nr:response regulator [Desulforhopalus sp. IMCC35007]TKB09662.1 response regulator [Desulforhopalus sp. IMCC35007]
MKVLIVDDDTIVVESCRRILHAEGIVTQHAGTVEEAKAVLETEVFSAMITDIKMPKQDGFKLISWVKKHRPEMSVLMMTGYLTPDTQNTGLNSGADAFIAKPFTPDELLEQLYNHITCKF